MALDPTYAAKHAPKLLVWWFSMGGSVLTIIVAIGILCFVATEKGIVSALPFCSMLIIVALFQLQTCRVARRAFSADDTIRKLYLANARFRKWMDFWATVSILINLLALLPTVFLLLVSVAAIFMKDGPPNGIFSLFIGAAGCIGIVSSFIVAQRMLQTSRYYWGYNQAS